MRVACALYLFEEHPLGLLCPGLFAGLARLELLLCQRNVILCTLRLFIQEIFAVVLAAVFVHKGFEVGERIELYSLFELFLYVIGQGVYCGGGLDVGNLHTLDVGNYSAVLLSENVCVLRLCFFRGGDLRSFLRLSCDCFYGA